MARKRRRRKNKNSKHSSIKSILRKVVNQGAAPLAFWQQLSEKDYTVLNATPEYQGLDYLGKLKVAANILTGSLTGRVLFSDQYNPSPSGQPRINPAGIINKWTGIGIAAKIYGKIGHRGDVDTFSFRSSNGETFAFEAVYLLRGSIVTAIGHPDLILYNVSSSTPLATDDHGGLLFYRTGGGTMYLDVSSRSTSLTRDYMIVVHRIGP